MYLVYKHTSPSGKAYIGLTQDYDQRSIYHRNPNSKCKAFLAAIKKYGWDSFSHEILLQDLTVSEANEAEVRLIAEHQTLWPSGYNLTTGGDAYEMSDFTKEAQKQRWAGRSQDDRDAIFAKVLATKAAKNDGEKALTVHRRLQRYNTKTAAEKEAIKQKRADTRATWTDEQRAAQSAKISEAARKREAAKRASLGL